MVRLMNRPPEQPLSAHRWPSVNVLDEGPLERPPRREFPPRPAAQPKRKARWQAGLVKHFRRHSNSIVIVVLSAALIAASAVVLLAGFSIVLLLGGAS
jgi:hypothetical protein